MDFNKIRSVCRVIRIFAGVSLIIAGFMTGIFWFYLGLLPLLAGSLNFCPLCAVTGKCDLPQNGES